MRFRTITKGASIISLILWVAAASFWHYESLYSFFIVGILAALAQVVAVNSAKREGYDAAQRQGVVDKIINRMMDEVAE